MKICFPVKDSPGLESEVYGHFGSAPFFLLIDSATLEATVIKNADQHHSHGKCSPLRALGGHTIDAVITGGIGGGALNKLNDSGITVYRAEAPTVRGNLDLLNKGKLLPFRPAHTCIGHTHGSACAH